MQSYIFDPTFKEYILFGIRHDYNCYFELTLEQSDVMLRA